MRVHWELGDGYAGGSRPQHLTIDDEDLKACATREEQMDLVTEYIDEEIRNNITGSFMNDSELPDPEGE